MSKSKITTGKKDREKRKHLQRKEKMQKREDRKSNNNKGKGMDSMIAYVDEYGQLSSTPPDQTFKKPIKASDIEIGIARQGPPDPAELIRKGTVTFFNESKGYGFIRDQMSGNSVFVHANSLASPIKQNDKVSFEVERGPKGLNAIKVKAIK